jgi:hypothetical protein
MATLTAKARSKLKTSQFAEPAKRKYPIQDRVHSINALARVSQYGSPEEQVMVRTKVHRKYPQMGK